MKRLKKLMLIAGAMLSLPVWAMGDPDFELTAPGQIPKWSGGFWIRLSGQEFTADVVEDAAKAFKGKRFLHLDHPGKNSLSVGGFPRITCQPGKKYIIQGKVRGTGNLMLFMMRFDQKLKNRPWNSKAGTAYLKLDPSRWQDIRLEYVPQKEDFSMVPAFSIRNGSADIDDLRLTLEEFAGGSPEVPAAVVQEDTPERAVREPDPGGKARVCGFEMWQKNGLPSGWCFDPWRKGDQVFRILLSPEEPAEFGRYSCFLNGKLVMDPQVKFKDNIKGRRVRVSFYAKGKGGKFKVFLREGRYGHVDYLMEVFGGETTGEWKKYSGELALALGYVNNVAVELNGENIWIDNLEFSEVKSTYGMTSYVIPVIKTPPVIDGRISGSEWEFSGGAAAAFQVSGTANLSNALKRQTGFKLCSDGEYLYFLFSTPGAERLKADADKRDSAVYSDDSVELHINPQPGNSHPEKAYQLVFNSLGNVFDQCRRHGRFSKEFHRWNSETLTVKSKVDSGWWYLEGKIALAELGLTCEKPFSMNICLNRCHPTALGTISGGKFEDLGKMPMMVISAEQPSVYWENQDGYGNMTVKVFYPALAKGQYILSWQLDSQNTTVARQEELEALPGQSVPYFFNVPGGAGKFGNAVLALDRKDKTPLFRQAVTFSSAMEILPEPELPLELHILPEQNKVAVNIYPARRGYREFAGLTVSGLPGGEVKLSRKDLAVYDGMLFCKLPAGMVEGKNYSLRVSLFNAKGELLDSVNRHFTMDSSLILKDDAANYRGVIPPYKPLQYDSNRVKVSLREYVFGGNGLPERVISCGEEVLYAPVNFTAETASGEVLTGKSGNFEIISGDEEKLIFSGESRFPGFTVKLTGQMEYDGTIFYQGETVAGKPVKLRRLSVEIPVNKLDYFHSYLDTELRLWMCRQPGEGEYRHPSVPVWDPGASLSPSGFRRFVLYFFPAGDGLLWSSRKVVPRVIKNGFLPYLLFGNHRFGMEFFADTDRGWSHRADSSVHEIFRAGGKEMFRTNIIAAETVVENGRKFEFGLTVTPGREKTLTRKEDRRSYIGASHSSFMDRSCSPTVTKDAKLMDMQCARIVSKGELPILWMCKELYPQGDPIARYLDSEWRTRPGGKWLMHHYMPTQAFGLDPYDYEAPAGCFPASRIDFHSRRFDDLFRQVPHLMGVYWDENYMKPCGNPNHAGCVYLLPDGRTQGRAWWNAIREIDRRLRISMNRYGREEGSIALFTGEGIVPHAMAFGNVNTMGEHHTHGIDYIDYWTLHCTEIMAAGAWGIDVGFLGMFYEEKDRNNIALNRAQLAIVKLFNAHFQASWIFNQQLAKHFKKIDEAFDYSLPGTVFCGYFTEENKRSIRNLPPDVKASFYVHPGKNALIFITNLNKQNQKVSLQVDLSVWQLDSFEAFDAENGKALTLDSLEIKGHDLRVIELRKK